MLQRQQHARTLPQLTKLSTTWLMPPCQDHRPRSKPKLRTETRQCTVRAAIKRARDLLYKQPITGPLRIITATGKRNAITV